MRLDDIHTGPEKERSAPRFLFGKVPWILYTKRLCYARRHLINTSTHTKKKKTQESKSIVIARLIRSDPSCYLFIIFASRGEFFSSLSPFWKSKSLRTCGYYTTETCSREAPIVPSSHKLE